MAVEELKKLEALDFTKQLAFAYLTCERMFPNYVYFSENYGFGDPKILRDAIDFVYSAIFIENNIDKQKIEYFLKTSKANIPGPDDHGSYYGTIALDSGAIVYESIVLLKKEDTKTSLTGISTTATNLIDCFIQTRDEMDYGDVDFEEKILNDTVMQKEIAIQNGIISYLGRIGKVEPSDMETLMQLQESESKPLIVKH